MSDSDFAAFRPIRTQARRLITLGVKAGRPWNEATTVGAIAKAAKTTPEEVVRLLNDCAYLMGAVEVPGVPIAEWLVYEDGM